MANTISSLKLGSTIGVFAPPYATSSTGASTASKEATVQNSGNFALETSATVIVKFSNTNAASTPTLNVNGTGAKLIKYTGETFTDLIAGHLYEFIYDGTNWLVMNPPLVWHTF
jgi:hypothetical protein